jgi:hypothetical protein
MILGEVQSRVDGVAESQVDQTKRVKNAFNELKESLGGLLSASLPFEQTTGAGATATGGIADIVKIHKGMKQIGNLINPFQWASGNVASTESLNDILSAIKSGNLDKIGEAIAGVKSRHDVKQTPVVKALDATADGLDKVTEKADEAKLSLDTVFEGGGAESVLSQALKNLNAALEYKAEGGMFGDKITKETAQTETNRILMAMLELQKLSLWPGSLSMTT